MNRVTVLCSAALILLAIGVGACGSADQDPLVAQGERLYKNNCLSCHPTDPTQPRVGPYLVGLGANLEASGQDATTVLEESIRNPGSVITTGYQDLMPPAEVLGLGDTEIEALVAFLLALEESPSLRD
jgi:mono/diheme cytochrome c family protein